MEQWQFTIHGLVQGVGFRYFIEQHAQRLGVTGYVSNRADGSVEVYAEGDDRALSELEQLVRQGPSYADVTSVELHKTTAEGLWRDFAIQ